MRITKSKATVYSFSGGRRYLSRAAALGGLARQFVRQWFDEGHCNDSEMYAFAIRKLTELFRQAENEGHDDEWIATEWEKLFDAEYDRLNNLREAQRAADAEEESIL